MKIQKGMITQNMAIVLRAMGAWIICLGIFGRQKPIYQTELNNLEAAK